MISWHDVVLSPAQPHVSCFASTFSSSILYPLSLSLSLSLFTVTITIHYNYHYYISLAQTHVSYFTATQVITILVINHHHCLFTTTLIVIIITPLQTPIPSFNNIFFISFVNIISRGSNLIHHCLSLISLTLSPPSWIFVLPNALFITLHHSAVDRRKAHACPNAPLGLSPWPVLQ